MEIAQLKIVKEIHRAGSLSKASMRLNKAQSIVSRHLAAFEKECGGRIFHRNGRGVQLTELGEKILPQIDQIIGAMDQMIDCGKAPSGAVAGDVRITISSAICEYLVPRLFAAIKQDYPLIRLQIFEGYSSGIDHALEKGETDVAVFLCNGTSVSSHYEPICEYDTYLISLPGAPASERQEILFSELESLPLLLPSEPSLARNAISDQASRRGISLSIAAEVNSPATMQALFDAGVGYLIAAVGCGPAAETSHIGRQIKQGRLQAARIIDPDLKRTLAVGSPASITKRAEVVRKAAITILREAAQPVEGERVHAFGK